MGGPGRLWLSGGMGRAVCGQLLAPSSPRLVERAHAAAHHHPTDRSFVSSICLEKRQLISPHPCLWSAGGARPQYPLFSPRRKWNVRSWPPIHRLPVGVETTQSCFSLHDSACVPERLSPSSSVIYAGAPRSCAFGARAGCWFRSLCSRMWERRWRSIFEWTGVRAHRDEFSCGSLRHALAWQVRPPSAILYGGHSPGQEYTPQAAAPPTSFGIVWRPGCCDMARP